MLARLYELFAGLLCLGLGGLTLLTSVAMLTGMYSSPETYAANLFWVAVVATLISPPISVAGARLLLNKRLADGGLFSPTVLQAFGIFYGVLGAVILVLAIKEWDIQGVLGGASMVAGMPIAILLARARRRGHN